MTSTDDTLEDLIARISAGEPVDLDLIPAELLALPEVQRLLQMARVVGALDRNAIDAAIDDAAPAQLGPWRLLRLLGSGGMGEVWLGERSDGAVEHRVAVKRLRADVDHFRERLASERRILARLEHPNIARFIDAGVDARGAPWLALEFVDGVPISVWCTQQSLPLRARLQLFQKVCAAVGHAHRHLIVHRDLKPANVLVNAEGEPKLLDFGIAKLLDGSSSEHTSSALTPAYAAPEQLRGGEVSTATDVYSLGLLLFRMLSGVLPDTRTGDSAAAVLARLDEEETRRPSRHAVLSKSVLPYPATALEGDLDAIVAQAIRAQPEARYGSVAELSADIGRHLDARPVRARAPTRRYRLGRFVQRNRGAVALGMLAVTTLVVGSVISFNLATRAERESASAQRALARAERVSEFLGSLYREQDPLQRAGTRARTPDVLIAEAVARVQRELGDDPLSQAQLLRVLGEAQLNISDLSAARTTLDLARQRAQQGSAPLLSAEIDSALGMLARRELRLEDALVLLDRAVAVAEAERGADSLEATRMKSRRAGVLVALSRFEEARAELEPAYQHLVQQLGPLATETIETQLALAVAQEQMRDDPAALLTLRANVKAVESAFGPDHARLARVLLTLGEVLRRSRDFPAGRQALERAALIARQQFGAIDPELSNVLQRAATLERDAGDLPRSIALLDEAALALGSAEEDKGSRAQLLATRGGNWIELGDGGRAEADLREALRLRSEAGGSRSGLSWFTQAQLGQALALQGRFVEAHALQLEAAEQLREQLGPDAYQNALISIRRGLVYALQEDWRNATLHMREAVRLAEATYGRNHYMHFSWTLELASYLSKMDENRAEAAELADDLLARWTGKDEIVADYADLIELRCRLYELAGKSPEARRLARQALDREDMQATAAQRQALERIAREG